MQQLPLMTNNLKKLITIGMLVLVFGCFLTSIIIARFNIIQRKKDQVISLIYYTEYKTSN